VEVGKPRSDLEPDCLINNLFINNWEWGSWNVKNRVWNWTRRFLIHSLESLNHNLGFYPKHSKLGTRPRGSETSGPANTENNKWRMLSVQIFIIGVYVIRASPPQNCKQLLYVKIEQCLLITVPTHKRHKRPFKYSTIIYIFTSGRVIVTVQIQSGKKI